MTAEEKLKELGLPDADLSYRKVIRGMKCIWCDKYRPRDRLRCYGFINSDVDVCLEGDYSFYRTRVHRPNG